MNRLLSIALAAAALPSLPACYSCLGTTNQPGCASGYRASRVAVHRFDEVPEIGASVGATGSTWKQVTGVEELGTEWSIAVADGVLALGFPEIGAAVALSLTVEQDGCSWSRWDLDIDRSEETPETLVVRRASDTSGCSVDAVDVPLWLAEVGAGTSVGLGDVDGEDDDRELWLGNADGVLDRGTVRLLLDAVAWPATSDGSLTDPAAEVAFELVGERPGDRLGQEILACGDLDGGGRADWVFTAPGTSALPEPTDGPWWGEHGAVWVVLGEELPAEPSPRVLVGAQVGDALGSSASCESDIDGDGLADLVIGAPYAGLDESGAVYVVPGASVAGLGASTVVTAVAGVGTLRVANTWGFLGTGVATGDLVGGDGLPDLVLGAAGGEEGVGVALVIEGRARGEVTPDRVLLGTIPNVSASRAFEGTTPHYGERVAVADILGADGVLESVSVGSRASVRDSFHAGGVQLFSGEQTSAALTIDGLNAYARTGLRMIVTDVDGVPVLGEDGVERAQAEVVLTTHRRPNQ